MVSKMVYGAKSLEGLWEALESKKPAIHHCKISRTPPPKEFYEINLDASFHGNASQQDGQWFVICNNEGVSVTIPDLDTTFGSKTLFTIGFWTDSGIRAVMEVDITVGS